MARHFSRRVAGERSNVHMIVSMNDDIKSDNSRIDTWRYALNATVRPQCVVCDSLLWLPDQSPVSLSTESHAMK